MRNSGPKTEECACILSCWDGKSQSIRKILVSVKFVSAILGPEMGASILWTPGRCVLSAGKTMSIKFIVLGGGGILGFLGGECQFYLYSENSRRLWLFPGSVRGFSRKTPGKSRENCWKMFPESRNATNSGISGTGKGEPAENLGSTLPGPCPHLLCGVFFEIDSSSLLEFF